MSTRQVSRPLGGQHTEILVQFFADRVLVIVTQLSKVGTLIQASIPDTAPLLPAPEPNSQYPNQQPMPLPSPAIQLTPLIGSSPSEHMHTLHSLYASQIATIIWTQAALNAPGTSRRSVVVGLALKKSDGPNEEEVTEQEKELFQGVMSALLELLK
ncbi:hypothetical protein J132_07308 [Termitomyces sp. J132]|nr:hypothetical protein H2248_009395 [Termitomyces sp. 'cryptogamus']KNZ71819.1 hypothetical protein J132_07308 [Termitomyces sp. J132]